MILLSKNSFADHQKSPRIFLILGMHRSGSSLLTQLISKLGVHLGDEIMKADRFNPDGYWENLRVVDLHNRMLEEEGNQWYAPAHPIDTTGLLKKYREEALSLVSVMDRQGSDWVWKDPRMPLFLDFWLEILKGRNINFVITNRSPSAIAASLLHRDAIPMQISLDLWEMTIGMTLSRIKFSDDHLIINYDQLMQEPETEIPTLIRFVLGEIPSADMEAKKVDLLKLLKQDLNHGSNIEALPLNARRQFLLESCLQGKLTRDIVFNEADMDVLRTHFKLLQTLGFTPKTTDIIQLFYRETDAPFNESRSIILYEHHQPLVFRFDKPRRIIQLRIDPLNDHAVLKSLRIRFFKVGDEINVPFTMTANAFTDEDGTMYFHDKDPQIIFTFDEEKIPEMDQIEIHYDLIAKGIKALEISQAYTLKKISSSDAMIRRQEDEIHHHLLQQKHLLEKLQVTEEEKRMHRLERSILEIKSDESQKEISSLKATISDLWETIKRQDGQLQSLTVEIEKVKSSKSYRIGNALLRPVRYFSE